MVSVVTGAEAADRLDQRPGEEQHVPEAARTRRTARAASSGRCRRRRRRVACRNARVEERRSARALDLIAADEQRHPRSRAPGAHDLGGGAVLLEHERRRRLRPHDQPTPCARTASRVMREIATPGCGRERRMPLLLLRRRCPGRGRPRTVVPCRAARSRCTRRWPHTTPPIATSARRDRRPRATRVATGASTSCRRAEPRRRPGDERRQSVDADEARQLQRRQGVDLAVAERHPREARQQRAAHELGGHPDERRHEQRRARRPTRRPSPRSRRRAPGTAPDRRSAGSAASTASGYARPPNVTITSDSQYSVPAK